MMNKINWAYQKFGVDGSLYIKGISFKRTIIKETKYIHSYNTLILDFFAFFSNISEE